MASPIPSQRSAPMWTAARIKPLSPPSDASGWSVSFSTIGCRAGILAARSRVTETGFKSNPSFTATNTASFFDSRLLMSASFLGSTSISGVFSWISSGARSPSWANLGRRASSTFAETKTRGGSSPPITILPTVTLLVPLLLKVKGS